MPADDQPLGTSWSGSGLDLAHIALRAEKEAARRRARWEAQPSPRRFPVKRRPGNGSSVSLAAAIEELFVDVIDPLPEAPRVLAAWREEMGSRPRVRPVAFDPETRMLSVRADSPAWGVNMRLLAPQIISRLNERLGSDHIRRLRVEVPKAPVIPTAKRTNRMVAAELQAALDRQLHSASREPAELFQAGQEARSRAREARAQKAAVARCRAQAEAQRRKERQAAARTDEGEAEPGD